MIISDKKGSNIIPCWIFDALIIAVILLAYSPVLFNDYLRQDDWNGMLWNRHRFFSHGDIFNYVVELFRPVSGLVVLASDYINYHMEHAWITRLINVLLLCASALLTYRWQLKLKNEPVFAACFALCACLLPASQLIAAVGGYTLMILTVVCAQAACFLFYRGFTEPQKRSQWYTWGIIAMLLGILDYPLGATYIFIFLLIYYFCHLDEKFWKPSSFIFQATTLTLLCMAGVVVTAKLMYLVFHIVPQDPQRSVGFNWDIASKLRHWWVMLTYAVVYFDIDRLMPGFRDTTPLHNLGVLYDTRAISWHCVALWILLVTAGLFCHYGTIKGRAIIAYALPVFIIKNIAIILAVLTLAYAPALPPYYGGGYAYRYTLVTMPLALYTVFWSLKEIAIYIRAHFSIDGEGKYFRNAMFVATLGIAVLCTHDVSRYLAGLSDFELNFVRNAIEREALPALKEGKPVTLYLVTSPRQTCLPGEYHSLEYGWGIIHYTPGELFAAAVYTMREYGYESIESDPTWDVTWKDMIWNGEKIRMKLKWGYIYATKREVPHMEVPAGTKEVYIDFDKLGTYW